MIRPVHGVCVRVRPEPRRLLFYSSDGSPATKSEACCHADWRVGTTYLTDLYAAPSTLKFNAQSKYPNY